MTVTAPRDLAVRLSLGAALAAALSGLLLLRRRRRGRSCSKKGSGRRCARRPRSLSDIDHTSSSESYSGLEDNVQAHQLHRNVKVLRRKVSSLVRQQKQSELEGRQPQVSRALSTVPSQPIEDLRDVLQRGLRHARPKEVKVSRNRFKRVLTRAVLAPLASPPVTEVRIPGGVLTVRSFNEASFLRLRSLWKVDENQFWTSVCDMPLRAGANGAGKSGAKLFFTDDNVFVLKTITSEELSTLQRLLDNYTTHFEMHPDSLLSRFFGAFEIILAGLDFTFVIMNNAFSGIGSEPPSVIYDLKGTTEDRWVHPSKAHVLKDLNFADKAIGVPDSSVVEELNAIIRCDAEFLSENRIMDYSMLLGVRYNDDSEAQSHQEINGLESTMHSKWSALDGFEPVKAVCLVRECSVRRVTYVFGIIDILQEFNWRKVVAHIFKSCTIGWFHEIDTEAPAFYASRYMSYFERKIMTFVEPDDKVSKFIENVIAADTVPLAMPRTFQGEKVLLEALNFCMREGGRLMLTDVTTGLFRCKKREVEMWFDPNRLVLAFKIVGNICDPVVVPCDSILAVHPCSVADRSREMTCHECRSTIGVEEPPISSRRFMVKAAGCVDLRFEAPSRRQMALWVTLLEAIANLLRREDAESHLLDLSSKIDVPLRFTSLLFSNRLCQASFLERQFRVVDRDSSGTLDSEEIKQGLLDLNLDPKGVKAFGQVVGGTGKKDVGKDTTFGALSRDNYREVLLELDQGLQKTLMPYFKNISNGKSIITADELLSFLADRQGHRFLALESVQNLLESWSGSDGVVTQLPSPGLTPCGFVSMLFSIENCLIDFLGCKTVTHDMTMPLNEYWISTSHNTYLEGNQYSSRSGVLPYVEVLHRGCRCVEVDVWDGPDGEPLVKHGYTATTSVKFEDVLYALADHAFIASPYPLILSIEQHCSTRQLQIQADLMIRVLGDRLLRPPFISDTGAVQQQFLNDLPSPEEARGMFIVKSRICHCKRCRRSVNAYNQCVYLPTCPIQIHQEVEELIDSHGACSRRSTRNVSSISEVRGSTWLKDEIKTRGSVWRIREWHGKYISRLHPKGTRLDSSNLDPLKFWSAGFQMCAINFQTSDDALKFNEALFENQNGCCGFSLKSARARGKATLGNRICSLSLRIVCAYRLPRPAAATMMIARGVRSSAATKPSSPYVKVSLTTTEGRREVKTTVVHQNGFDPSFEFETTFVIPKDADPELIFLSFEVIDSGMNLPMAHMCTLLGKVRPGLRWVPLLRPQGGSFLKNAGLLVDVALQFEPTNAGSRRPSLVTPSSSGSPHRHPSKPLAFEASAVGSRRPSLAKRPGQSLTEFVQLATTAREA